MNGYNRLQVLRKVVLPLAAPGIAVTAIFCLIFSWNEFLFAYILTRDAARTITVGVESFFTLRGILWGPVAAAATISVVRHADLCAGSAALHGARPDLWRGARLIRRRDEMVFWQMWEVAFQAFMIFIGVGIIWLRFIEPLLASQQTSVTLMIIVAVGLAAFRIILGVRGIRREQKALQAQIAGLNGQAQEAK